MLPNGEDSNVTIQGETIDIHPWTETRYDTLVPETVPPEQEEQSNSDGAATGPVQSQTKRKRKKR